MSATLHPLCSDRPQLHSLNGPNALNKCFERMAVGLSLWLSLPLWPVWRTDNTPTHTHPRACRAVSCELGSCSHMGNTNQRLEHYIVRCCESWCVTLLFESQSSIVISSVTTHCAFVWNFVAPVWPRSASRGAGGSSQSQWGRTIPLSGHRSGRQLAARCHDPPKREKNVKKHDSCTAEVNWQLWNAIIQAFLG